MENLMGIPITTSDPDYALAQETAYQTIAESNQHVLPINVLKVIHSYPKIHIQSYSEFAAQRGTSVEYLCNSTGSEDGATYKRSDGTFLILYNNLIDNFGRKRFTLAHELGHILLDHFSKSNCLQLNRGLSDSEYDLFEKEANYFAKRFLAPIPLVDLSTHLFGGKNDDSNIRELFNLSATVSNYVINDINRRYRKTSIISESHRLNKNFESFFEVAENMKLCTKCHGIIPKSKKYCRFCGNNEFVEALYDHIYNYMEEFKKIMKYSKLEVDDEGRLAEPCPKCGNDHLQNNYCTICGTYIINKCSGWKTTDTGIEYQDDPCDGHLEGRDRYCSICGASSTFLNYGLLKRWDDKSADILDISDISDSDLPF